MIITIQFDTKNLSEADLVYLAAFAGVNQETVAAQAQPAPEPTPPAAEPATRSRRAPKKAAETVPESAPVDLRAKAVARASELLSAGQRDRVMAALQATGAPRVSEIADESLSDFLVALTD